jgi:hypothetical protein
MDMEIVSGEIFFVVEGGKKLRGFYLEVLVLRWPDGKQTSFAGLSSLFFLNKPRGASPGL